jgi:hypothetical protein
LVLVIPVNWKSEKEGRVSAKDLEDTRVLKIDVTIDHILKLY